MTNCPKCQTQFRAGAKFCLYCGAPLLTSCPKCQTPNRVGAKFCLSCGAAFISCAHCQRPLLKTSRYCLHCGQPVPGMAGEYCPYSNCRRPIQAGATFCAGCGRPIRICPQCKSGNRHDAKFCLRCGQRLEWGSPAHSTGLTALQQGRYVLQYRIDQGQGGMSAVYKAVDTHHPQQPVAIKEINGPRLKPTERDDILAAFTQEATMLTRLNHPGLIKVFGSFEENQCHYMVMEFLAGRTLLEFLQRDAPAGLPVNRVKPWAIQMCEVLGFLHAQTPKIIYRDMKPANVMALNPAAAQIKLFDFGIARFHKGGKTKDTITFGTPGYAPPEQYGRSNAETDERADIYALGATLHYLLTGQDPSVKPFFFAPAHILTPNIPLAFSLAIAQAVENNRNNRFASMAEMKTALLSS